MYGERCGIFNEEHLQSQLECLRWWLYVTMFLDGGHGLTYPVRNSHFYFKMGNDSLCSPSNNKLVISQRRLLQKSYLYSPVKAIIICLFLLKEFLKWSWFSGKINWKEISEINWRKVKQSSRNRQNVMELCRMFWKENNLSDPCGIFSTIVDKIIHSNALVNNATSDWIKSKICDSKFWDLLLENWHHYVTSLFIGWRLVLRCWQILVLNSVIYLKGYWIFACLLSGILRTPYTSLKLSTRNFECSIYIDSEVSIYAHVNA